MYRTRFPLKGNIVTIDKDIEVRLENKICGCLLRIFISDEQEE